MPVGVIGLIIAALLAAAISSLDAGTRRRREGRPAIAGSVN